MPKSVKVSTQHWFSGAVIPNPDNPLEVVAFEYCYDHERQPGRIQFKFPGGSRKETADRYDKSPEVTLRREIEEEVFKNRRGEVRDWELLSTDNSRAGHTKFFFRVSDCWGEFRQEDLFEEDKGRVEELPEDRVSRTERMGPPRYMNIKELAKVIFYSHAPALRAYCEWLGVQSTTFAFEVMEAISALDARSSAA